MVEEENRRQIQTIEVVREELYYWSRIDDRYKQSMKWEYEQAREFSYKVPVGRMIGWALGCDEGCSVGCWEGWMVGTRDGWEVGCCVGCLDGWLVGIRDGWEEGWRDGTRDGWALGCRDGWPGVIIVIDKTNQPLKVWSQKRVVILLKQGIVKEQEDKIGWHWEVKDTKKMVEYGW